MVACPYLQLHAGLTGMADGSLTKLADFALRNLACGAEIPLEISRDDRTVIGRLSLAIGFENKSLGVEVLLELVLKGGKKGVARA